MLAPCISPNVYFDISFFPIRIPTNVSCLSFFAAGDDKANVWLKDAELGWVHARTREAVLKIREITTGVDMMVFILMKESCELSKQCMSAASSQV